MQLKSIGFEYKEGISIVIVLAHFLNKVKGVAQPYLSLWELSRELQQWDKSETFHDCRVDLVGELP